jgi:DNA-binding NtrC family response regulator
VVAEVFCNALAHEPDAAIAGLLRTVLARDGFTVQVAAKSTEAIQHLASGVFNLAVVDVGVRDDGHEVIAYLKQHRLDLLKAVIVISADTRVIRSALHGQYPEPICKFVPMPFDIHEFRRAVHSCKQLCENQTAEMAAGAENEERE